MRLHAAIAALNVAAALLLGGQAAAATLSATHDVTAVTTTFGSGALNRIAFDLFDPARGQLTGFTLTDQAIYQLDVTFDQSGGTPGHYNWYAMFDGAFDAFEDIDFGPTPPGLDVGQSAFYDGTAYPGDVGIYSTGAVIQPIATYTVTDPVDLLSLTGLGTTRLAIFSFMTVYKDCISDCGPLHLQSRLQHQITVTYTYDAVPEPEVWLLMSLGFGGLGGMARRRRGQRQRMAAEIW